MSDNKDTNSTQKVQEPSTSGQTPDSTPQSQVPAQGKVLTEEQVNALVEKARADEKSKVFGKLEEQKTAKAKAEELAKELESKLKATQTDLDSIRQGKASELESVANELKALRENNQKLEKAIEETASIAAAQIREFEVKAYRERRIRESGVKLEKLVTGNSEQEIDAAIESARKDEMSLLEAYKAEQQKKVADSLPGPLAPNGSEGRGPSLGLTPQTREAIASLKGEEYEKRRAQILLDAKQRSGAI
jgi:DNA repair exonuclease SbcCD ATPase subunit